jgi:hypothetical protein
MVAAASLLPARNPVSFCWRPKILIPKVVVRCPAHIDSMLFISPLFVRIEQNLKRKQRDFSSNEPVPVILLGMNRLVAAISKIDGCAIWPAML